MSENLMTPAEVAAFLRVSTKTVHRHRTAGRLAGRRVGSLWRFAEADVAVFGVPGAENFADRTFADGMARLDAELARY